MTKDRRTRAELLAENNGLKAQLHTLRLETERKLESETSVLRFDMRAAQDALTKANARNADMEKRVIALEGELVATRPDPGVLAATEERLRVLQTAYDGLLAERDRAVEERETWRAEFLREQRDKMHARELLIRQAHLAGEVAKLATNVSMKNPGA